MVKPAARCQVVGYLQQAFGLSERRACGVASLCRATHRYEPRRTEPPGWEVHHVRKNKLDARGWQLQRLSPEDHARISWRGRRSYSRKKKEPDVGGFYRPRMPGAVKKRDDMIGETRPLDPEPRRREK